MMRLKKRMIHKIIITDVHKVIQSLCIVLNLQSIQKIYVLNSGPQFKAI